MHRKILVLALTVTGLLMLALVTRSGDVAWMALPFLAYLGLGLWKSPLAAKVRLSAARTLEISRKEGVSTIEVTVKVANQGLAIDHLYLDDGHQAGMDLTSGQTEMLGALRTGEEMELKYTFQSHRGAFTWEKVTAVVSDPLDLIETPFDLPAAAKANVQPELSRYRSLPLHPQTTLHSAGSIPARLGGSGTDFWGVREYQPGDPLRRLDWRLTARHPRQFFTKEFEQEEIADIGLILDARYKTNLEIGEESLFEHSARAAASMAEVFLRQGNRVSLLIYGHKDITLYPGYGKRHLNRILNALAQVTIEPDAKVDSLSLVPLHVFSSRSLIFVFSPLATNDWELFPRLRAHGFQVLLISPDPLDFARDVLPTDPLTEISGRLARLDRRLEIGKIAALWIPVIDWQVSQPLSPLVRNALLHAHVMQER
jgi:uncharacterized protein (DUF58 family)